MDKFVHAARVTLVDARIIFISWVSVPAATDLLVTGDVVLDQIAKLVEEETKQGKSDDARVEGDTLREQ